MLLRIQSTQLYRKLTTMKWGKPSDSMKSGLKTTNGLQPLTQSFAQDICRQVPSSEDHCAIKDQENSEDVSFKSKTIWLSDNHTLPQQLYYLPMRVGRGFTYYSLIIRQPHIATAVVLPPYESG